MRKNMIGLAVAVCLLLSACVPGNTPGAETGQNAAGEQITKEAENNRDQQQMKKDALAQPAEEESRNVENAKREFAEASSEVARASREVDQASGRIDEASALMEREMENNGAAFEGILPETASGKAGNEGFGSQRSQYRESAGQKTAQSEEKRPDTASSRDKGVSLPNPVRQVDSPKEFEKIGLRLGLPENEEWYRDASFSIISDQVAQIQFYDNKSESDAIARAGKKENGDPSGIYYKFDEDKQENWFTTAYDGSRIDLTVKVTVENSDVPGVLVSWENDEMLYTLWEDRAREKTDLAAKMGSEIARMSSRKE